MDVMNASAKLQRSHRDIDKDLTESIQLCHDGYSSS